MSESGSTSHIRSAIWVAVIAGLFAICGTSVTVFGGPIIQQLLQSSPSQNVVADTPDTPTATYTPANTPLPTATDTPLPKAADTPLPTATDTPTATYTPTNTPSPTPTVPRAEDFVGHWVNQNPATGGITRVEIVRRLNDLVIQMWGACVPTDCDWGTETTDVSDSDDGILSITWDPSFKEIAQQITILPDGRLQVVGHTHFTDNSGRPDIDSTDYFRRD